MAGHRPGHPRGPNYRAWKVSLDLGIQSGENFTMNKTSDHSARRQRPGVDGRDKHGHDARKHRFLRKYAQ
jgi:hypothetical protein